MIFRKILSIYYMAIHCQILFTWPSSHMLGEISVWISVCNSDFYLQYPCFRSTPLLKWIDLTSRFELTMVNRKRLVKNIQCLLNSGVTLLISNTHQVSYPSRCVFFKGNLLDKVVVIMVFFFSGICLVVVWRHNFWALRR